jgi:chromate transporter
MFVEEKQWMTSDEFNEAYAFCQFLPGPNIVNLTAIFGYRLHSVSGALACWAGFLAMPFVFMCLIGALYEMFSGVDVLRRILTGLAAAAAGLLIATVAKMAVPLCRRIGFAPVVMVATAAAIGLIHWPLLWVMIVVVPVSIAGTAWERRSGRAR